MRHVTWFLMDVTAETADWQEHLGKDTFLFSPADAAAKLSHNESRDTAPPRHRRREGLSD